MSDISINCSYELWGEGERERGEGGRGRIRELTGNKEDQEKMQGLQNCQENISLQKNKRDRERDS